jgi:hypothetical protein
MCFQLQAKVTKRIYINRSNYYPPCTMNIWHLLSTSLQIYKVRSTQISARPVLGHLYEPLILDQARSIFGKVRANSATFCLRVDKINFNTQHEE